jgi:hypothetical protein
MEIGVGVAGGTLAGAMIAEGVGAAAAAGAGAGAIAQGMLGPRGLVDVACSKSLMMLLGRQQRLLHQCRGVCTA